MRVEVLGRAREPSAAPAFERAAVPASLGVRPAVVDLARLVELFNECARRRGDPENFSAKPDLHGPLVRVS